MCKVEELRQALISASEADKYRVLAELRRINASETQEALGQSQCAQAQEV